MHRTQLNRRCSNYGIIWSKLSRRSLTTTIDHFTCILALSHSAYRPHVDILVVQPSHLTDLARQLVVWTQDVILLITTRPPDCLRCRSLTTTMDHFLCVLALSHSVYCLHADILGTRPSHLTDLLGDL